MAQEQRTEEGLIERARSGDRRAQERLWSTHRRWVAAIVLAHRPRAIDVEDLMQEAAVKFVSRIDTLRDPGAFRPWLRQIVINVCRGAARVQRPTLSLREDVRTDEMGETERLPIPESPIETAPSLVGTRDSALRVLERALTLPPEYREPLLLRCIRSLSYQQIGIILELPVTTVETRLARARRMLREEIGEPSLTEEIT